MKKHITILLYLLLASTYLMAQCDDEIISTFPPQTDNRTAHTGLPPQNYNPFSRICNA
jgi:hypothetical protein